MKYKVCHFVYSKHGSFIIKVVYLQGNSMKDCPLYSINALFKYGTETAHIPWLVDFIDSPNTFKTFYFI